MTLQPAQFGKINPVRRWAKNDGGDTAVRDWEGNRYPTGRSEYGDIPPSTDGPLVSGVKKQLVSWFMPGPDER